MHRRRTMTRHATSAAAVVWSLAIVGLDAQSPYDIIIRHGTVLDGTGAARDAADVAIADGFIVRVGDLGRERAAVEIDAKGLDVAPGFINIHSHATPDALPTAENILTQGVTTEIVNADAAPSATWRSSSRIRRAAGWPSTSAPTSGFNSIWSTVVGPADRRPLEADLAKMRAMILDGLEHGAWGVSAGLPRRDAGALSGSVAARPHRHGTEAAMDARFGGAS